MSFDHYRARLAEAAWTWLERRSWWKRGSRLRKDRRAGREAKRGARQEAQAEMDRDKP